jgi:hypothetical protein
MHKTIIAASLFAALAGTPAMAGCLTGAAVGGVAGHVAGHHGVLGAAAGCAVGHHESVKHQREQAAAAQNSQTRSQPASTGTDAGAADTTKSQ